MRKMYYRRSHETTLYAKLMLVFIFVPAIASYLSACLWYPCTINTTKIPPQISERCSRLVVRYAYTDYVSLCRLLKSHICPLLRTGKALPPNRQFNVPS